MSPRLTPAALAGVVASQLSGCAHPGRIELAELDRRLDPAPRPAAPEPTADAAAVERLVAGTAPLAAMIQLALVRNPDLAVDRARIGERLARIPLAAQRPDLELKYEQWGVPLARPYALDEADTLMIGVRQTLPPAGSLPAQERAAVADAEIALYALRGRQLDVAHQIERAYVEYCLVDREDRIHRDHVALAQHIIELTRAGLRTGSASQGDVLRLAVDLQRLHRDLARVEQRKRSALALLNALMGRPRSAALAPAPAPEPAGVASTLDQLHELAVRHRPEALAPGHGIARERASTEAARAAATWPSVMVGVDYMYMPFMHERHAYGAMLSVNLPWLNPAHRDRVAAAERAVDAERHAARAAAVVVGYQVDDAFARYQAARSSYLVSRDDLLPAAQQSFEAARSGFVAGRGNALAIVDALRMVLEVRLEESRERFALDAAIADLRRAVGTEIPAAALTAGHGGSHD